MMYLARVKGQGGHFANLVDQVEAKLVRLPGGIFIYLFLLTTFLIFISTSTTLFNFFKCHEFNEATMNGGGPKRYLFRDYSIDCDSSRYSIYMIYAGLMILVFPIGIPLIYWMMLWEMRETLTSPSSVDREMANGAPTIGHLSFLVDAYKPEFYWFEVLECIRRLCLGCVVGLADPESAASAVMGIVASIAFILVFTACEPFKMPQDSQFAVILSTSLTLLFLAALMIKVDLTSDDDDDQLLFGILLIFITGAGPLMVAIHFWWDKIASILGVAICVFGMYKKKPGEESEEEETRDDQSCELGDHNPRELIILSLKTDGDDGGNKNKLEEGHCTSGDKLITEGMKPEEHTGKEEAKQGEASMSSNGDPPMKRSNTQVVKPRSAPSRAPSRAPSQNLSRALNRDPVGTSLDA
mmetsp:Transcript_38085/g.85056  ORF Transcript_38085/g.85056 Transcript_38085/m.85056 type:complete len:411 (-) Transcript_38085:203-1435(-)